MKALILAAGYATRLFPLTENFPKHLLEVGGKTILDYLMEKIMKIDVSEIVLVTNNKYYDHFVERSNNVNYELKVEVINDNTMSNDDKLGAIGDMQFAIEEAGLDDDLLVVCADNLFEFGLEKSVEMFQKTSKSVIVAYDIQDLEKAKSLGIVAVDENNKVTDFVEKPDNPPSTLASVGIYIYPQNVVAMVKWYLEEWNNPDSPGNFPAWLLEREDIYAQAHTEQWYDVGTHAALEAAKGRFGD